MKKIQLFVLTMIFIFVFHNNAFSSCTTITYKIKGKIYEYCGGAPVKDATVSIFLDYECKVKDVTASVFLDYECISTGQYYGRVCYSSSTGEYEIKYTYDTYSGDKVPGFDECEKKPKYLTIVISAKGYSSTMFIFNFKDIKLEQLVPDYEYYYGITLKPIFMNRRPEK